MAVLKKRGKKWSIVESFRDPSGKPTKRFHATGVGCKRAAEALLKTFHENRDRGVAGIADPRRQQLDRPAIDWLAAYLTELECRGTSPEYVREVGRVLKLILTITTTKTAREFTTSRVRAYLSASGKSAPTRNMHRAYVGGFFAFLTGDGKPYEVCPFSRHSVPLVKAGQRRQARRAFTVAELKALLVAVEEYPLASRLAGTGGRPRADGTPAVRRKPVCLSDASRDMLKRVGRERQLLYRTAIHTGLRRGELSRLTVNSVFLSGRPRIVATKTKNKREATIPLVPTLAADLTDWIAETGRKSTDRLFVVPCAGNLSRLHQAQLKHAGMSYRDANGVPATFHSLRRTVNGLLRRAGVSKTARQRWLRHAARGVTDAHYDDAGSSTCSKLVFKRLKMLDAEISSTSGTSG